MEYVEIDKHKMHVIDWYWVGKTKAWIIPGTEDMMPYIYGKTLISKWVSSSNSNGGIEASRKLTA